jgi:hypothetical protein
MSESEKQLPDQVAPADGGVKAVRRQRPIRGRVYYEERRKRVAELRAIGNLTFDQIGERICAYGFEPMTGERAWRDYQLYMKESAKALNAVEHRSEIVTKFEGLFSLAIMAYKDAQRQTKEGTKVPDPYAQGILLQRAMEILERLAELYGFLSRRGFSVTQTVNTDQKQMAFSFREMVNQHRIARGLAPLPPDDK